MKASKEMARKERGIERRSEQGDMRVRTEVKDSPGQSDFRSVHKALPDDTHTQAHIHTKSRLAAIHAAIYFLPISGLDVIHGQADGKVVLHSYRHLYHSAIILHPLHP